MVFQNYYYTQYSEIPFLLKQILDLPNTRILSATWLGISGSFIADSESIIKPNVTALLVVGGAAAGATTGAFRIEALHT